MTLYVDEHDSAQAESLLDSDPILVASRLTEETLCRSLDSVHLAAALRAGSATALLTFDIRQAQVARSVGLTVRGA